MGELHRALGDIRSIRRQVALTTQFRGLGPLTLASTGVLALLAGWVQAHWVRTPLAEPLRYVGLWTATAALSLAVIGISTLTRTHRVHSGIANEMIRLAAEHFAPALMAGAMLSLLAMTVAPMVLPLLPGLWQIVYALGIFASSRFLPRATLASVVWYLVSGLLCLVPGGSSTTAPWRMAFPFAAGQGLMALSLFLSAKEDSDEI